MAKLEERLRTSLEEALETPEPVLQFRLAVAELLAEGFSREAILDRLEVLVLHLREANNEYQEDMVLDVMDFVVGWCSPHMKL